MACPAIIMVHIQNEIQNWKFLFVTSPRPVTVSRYFLVELQLYCIYHKYANFVQIWLLTNFCYNLNTVDSLAMESKMCSIIPIIYNLLKKIFYLTLFALLLFAHHTLYISPSEYVILWFIYFVLLLLVHHPIFLSFLTAFVWQYFALHALTI